jgi:hypothetical protein
MKADLELGAALRNLQSLDLTIAALCKKFGDDVDRQRPYWTAEDRRCDVLDRLASTPAALPEGMVAKARAIKVVSVSEDPGRQAAIAASLAADVLRYFSRAV